MDEKKRRRIGVNTIKAEIMKADESDPFPIAAEKLAEKELELAYERGYRAGLSVSPDDQEDELNDWEVRIEMSNINLCSVCDALSREEMTKEECYISALALLTNIGPTDFLKTLCSRHGTMTVMCIMKVMAMLAERAEKEPSDKDNPEAQSILSTIK